MNSKSVFFILMTLTIAFLLKVSFSVNNESKSVEVKDSIKLIHSAVNNEKHTEVELKNSKIKADYVLDNLLGQIGSDIELYEKNVFILEQYCEFHKNCASYVRKNLEIIFDWKIEKTIVLFELAFKSEEGDLTLLEEILKYNPTSQTNNLNHHHDTKIQKTAIVKSIALEEFNNKVHDKKTSHNENEKFKLTLSKLVRAEKDLMIVRDAIEILVNSFSVDRFEIQELVVNRPAEDMVVYQDFL